jgi:hypothetical protein
MKKSIAGPSTLVLSGLLALSATAQLSQLGPVIELSQPYALAGCDDGFQPPGTMTINDAAEPFVAVNPVHPNNIVAAWIGGLFQNLITAVSFDGGLSWQQLALPLTVCTSSQPYLGGGDPWLSFAPNGDLHAIVIVGPSFSFKSIEAVKSTDGGLHWSTPIILDTPDFGPDKCTISADPTDSRFVYAAWVRQDAKNHDDLAFSRTTDGGQTWEPTRSVLRTPSAQFAYNTQILVLPDGTLVDIFEVQFNKVNGPVTSQNLQLMRSSDKGLTWSAPIPAVTMQTILTPGGNTLTIDPDTAQSVRDTDDPSFAVDNHSGNLYAVWEDGRFSNFQYNDIAFSMSSDGGLTWSTPIKVNQTPLNIPPLNRQAWQPIVSVAPNGTIAVTYYDFRFNTPDPGVPTDCWLVQCHPTPSASPTGPASWGNELRLTPASFNLEAAQFVIDGLWLGDYFGLAPVGGGGFVSVFAGVDQNGVTAMFAHTVGQ